MRILISVTCALLMFTLLGCRTLPDGETLPKEKFLRENSDATRTYRLWETSIEALKLAEASRSTGVLIAYDSLKTEFSNNVELIEYLEKQSQRARDLHDKRGQKILKLEEKMSPGRTLYEFYLTEEKRNASGRKRTESGKLILDRKGNLIWREVEAANYPFWEQESAAEPQER